MKANELMIGDWISYNGQLLRVNCAAIGSIGLEGADSDIICKEEMVKPIPITAKILEKNEFVMYDSSWWYRDFRIPVLNGHSLICGRVVQLKYVHELQHCLKLAGIKKDIVL